MKRRRAISYFSCTFYIAYVPGKNQDNSGIENQTNLIKLDKNMGC